MRENTKEAIPLSINKSRFSQNKRVVWSVIGIIVLVMEIYIAIFIKGGFIRHYIEAAQYLKILEILGVKSSILRIIFGGTFDWTDIICYLAGCILAFLFENLSMQKSKAW